MSGNILQRIVEQKRVEVARLPTGAVSVRQLRDAMSKRGGIRDFQRALAHPRSGDIGLIAEIKKASPSAGVISPDFDPIRIAKEYEAAGAGCLSILTDEKFFQGSLEYLRRVREVVGLPLLRKDFIIDERQILEAVANGADAILLIVAILNDDDLRHFHALATAAGLSVLVEVHDDVELERALRIEPALLGVNNRDLKSFKVDLSTTERLSKRWKAAVGAGKGLLVAESGIHSREDVIRLKATGSGAILVGESLMRTGSIREKVAELIGVK